MTAQPGGHFLLEQTGVAPGSDSRTTTLCASENSDRTTAVSLLANPALRYMRISHTQSLDMDSRGRNWRDEGQRQDF